jgi:hypothetical protein
MSICGSVFTCAGARVVLDEDEDPDDAVLGPLRGGPEGPGVEPGGAVNAFSAIETGSKAGRRALSGVGETGLAMRALASTCRARAGSRDAGASRVAGDRTSSSTELDGRGSAMGARTSAYAMPE